MRPASSRGFTLLEVMVSIGILGVALLAIGDINGGAVRMHAYGKRLTVATQLARGKMLDIQQMLRKDGLSDFSREYHGDFEKDGEPTYKWRAMVVKPEFDVDPQSLISMASSGLGLGGDASSPGAQTVTNPLASGGMLNGLLDGQIKGMSEAVKQSVREVKLTVSWKGGRGEEETFDLVEHLVILPNAMQNAAANATPMTPGAPGPNGTNPAPGMGVPGLTPMQLGGFRPQLGLPGGGVK
jgi:general secretion pathway protein I